MKIYSSWRIRRERNRRLVWFAISLGLTLAVIALDYIHVR